MFSASSRLGTHALSIKCIASSTKRILTYIDPIMTSSTTRELFTYAHPGSCSERKFTHAVSVEGATSKSPPTTWKGHDTKDQHQGYEKTWTKGILTYPDPIMPSCSDFKGVSTCSQKLLISCKGITRGFKKGFTPWSCNERNYSYAQLQGCYKRY